MIPDKLILSSSKLFFIVLRFIFSLLITLLFIFVYLFI